MNSLRVITTLFAIYQLTNPAVAQWSNATAQIVWGESDTSKSGYPLQEILGEVNGSYYAIKKDNYILSKASFHLERYDEQMNLLQSAPIDMKPHGEYKGMVIHAGKLWMFHTQDAKDGQQVGLVTRQIDPTTLLPTGQQMEVAKTTASGWSSGFLFGKGNRPVWRLKEHEPVFLMDQSPDKQYLALVSTSPSTVSRTKSQTEEALTIQVRDESMNAVLYKEITFPWSQKLFDVVELRADNQGNAYLLGVAYHENRKDQRQGLPNYEYLLYVYTNPSTDAKEHRFNLPGKFISDMTLSVDDRGNIAAAGFYTSKPSDQPEGTFYFLMDGQSKEVLSSNTEPFDQDFMNASGQDVQSGSKRASKANKGQEWKQFDLVLRKLSPAPGGGWLLVGEQHRQEDAGAYMGGPIGEDFSGTKHYYYHDIVVVRISADGQLLWTSKIPKRQHSTDDNGFFASFVQGQVDDKFYFLYNENPHNLTENDDAPGKYFTPGKESAVVLVTLDAQGNMEKTTLFDAQQSQVIVRPKVSRLLDRESVVLAGQRKKVHRLAKVQF